MADRVRQHRQQHPDALAIIVEGSPDKRVIERVVPMTRVGIFPVGPRPRVLQVADDLLHAGDPSWLCVVDRDFDREVEAKLEAGLAVVTYDNADLEAMIWGSPVLEEFLAEVGSERKLDEMGGVGQLRALIVEALLPLARLRAANADRGWGLDFDSLEIRKKADKRSLRLPLQSICDALAADAGAATRAEIYEAAETFPIRTCPSTGAPLIHGKEAVEMTGVALRSLVGNMSHQSADPSELQKNLRLAARTVHLQNTTWFQAVQASMMPG